MRGRRSVMPTLTEGIATTDKTIWFHCASLGEYEQGLPIMESIREQFPEYKIILTFFSPSGYEIRKNSELADVVCYLPLDTRGNARKFVEIVHPSLAIFVKYEFWPNYLFELSARSIPSLLVSGLFRPNQVFFKPRGFFMRKALATIDHFFVQNDTSMELLNSIEINNVSISGDTRFDRVCRQIEQDNSLPYLREFKGDSLCVVCGSTWPEDEALLIRFINESESEIKFIVAPHIIDEQKIEGFRTKLKKPSVRYSSMSSENIKEASVFILDTIGLLNKAYSYADIAYVGGGMGTSGLHNILEPATFGVPIIIGKNYKKFPEAIRLESLAGLFSVNTSEELITIMNTLIQNTDLRNKTGMICGHFVNSNTGATEIIMNHIRSLHSDGLI